MVAALPTFFSYVAHFLSFFSFWGGGYELVDLRGWGFWSGLNDVTLKKEIPILRRFGVIGMYFGWLSVRPTGCWPNDCLLRNWGLMTCIMAYELGQEYEPTSWVILYFLCLKRFDSCNDICGWLFFCVLSLGVLWCNVCMEIWYKGLLFVQWSFAGAHPIRHAIYGPMTNFVVNFMLAIRAASL